MGSAKDFVVSLLKEPVIVNRDHAGFIVNRINGMASFEPLRPLKNAPFSLHSLSGAQSHPFGAG